VSSGAIMEVRSRCAGRGLGQTGSRCWGMQDVEVEDHFFREQLANMSSRGVAAAPDGSNNWVGNVAEVEALETFGGRPTRAQLKAIRAARDAIEASGATRVGYDNKTLSAVESGQLTEQQRQFRKDLGLPEDRLDEFELGGRGASSSSSAAAAASSDDAAYALRRRRRRGEDAAAGGVSAEAATSEFVGKEQRDYQGRTWMEPSPEERSAGDADPLDSVAHVPRKCLHRFTGHTKGVQALAFFPQYGHLLLSGGLDTTVRIWKTGGTRACQRIYKGHTAAVRQVTFQRDGSKFASASFDKHVKIWDTETGHCRGTFQTASMGVPYCVTFYPEDENLFLVGGSDRKITQFDMRSGEITQTYDYHTDTVNTVTYIEDGRRIVSTGDDKKILVWDHGINVPVRWIADPSMHSMPAVALSPTKDNLAVQSMNNQILCYSVTPKVVMNRKKKFTGHINAGYACQLSFSPNGKYLASGDGQGRLWVWEWSSRKSVAKIPAHESGPCIGCQWHPADGSVLATCGWDGVVKLWGSASSK
jgi:pre-mRNA-processing factor 17